MSGVELPGSFPPAVAIDNGTARNGEQPRVHGPLDGAFALLDELVEDILHQIIPRPSRREPFGERTPGAEP